MTWRRVSGGSSHLRASLRKPPNRIAHERKLRIMSVIAVLLFESSEQSFPTCVQQACRCAMRRRYLQVQSDTSRHTAKEGYQRDRTSKPSRAIRQGLSRKLHHKKMISWASPLNNLGISPVLNVCLTNTPGSFPTRSAGTARFKLLRAREGSQLQSFRARTALWTQ